MEWIIAGLSGLGGALAGAVTAWRTRVAQAPQRVADVAATGTASDSVLVDTAMKIVDERNQENAALRLRVTDLELRVDALESWARQLAVQVIELGGVPAPFEGR